MRHLFYFRVMQKQEVLQLIDEKLQHLEETEKVNIWQGKISFGVHLPLYNNSPFLQAFLKKKKLIQRLIVFETFFLPFLVLTLSTGFWERLEAAFWKTIVVLLVNVFFLGLIFIYGSLRSLVRESISAQKEVKKMILHDLRQKVEALDVTDRVAQKTGAAVS